MTKLSSSLNFCLIFKSSVCLIQDWLLGGWLVQLKQLKAFYMLQKSLSPSFDSTFLLTVHNFFFENKLWHHRLGHPSNSRLVMINKSYSSIPFSSISHPCDVFHHAKQRRLPFPLSTSCTFVTIDTFQLIYVDILGAIFTPSIHGHKYFVTVVDNYSRHTWRFLMKPKSETRQLL